MKRMIKHIAVFLLFALLPFSAYADELSIVFATETELTVYVDNQWSDTLSGSYGFGDTATLNAPAIDGKQFSHWEADGSIISYTNPLKLTMNAHTTLYAVYSDTAPTKKPVAGFTSITRTNDGGKISFQAIADGTITGAGILYSTSASGNELVIGGSGVTNVVADKLTDSTSAMPKSILDSNNCWMLQLTPDSDSTAYHVKAYVIADGTTNYGDEKDVKLSDLESGVSLVANLGGLDPEDNLDNLLASMISEMKTLTYEANGGVGATFTQAFYGSSVILKSNIFTRNYYTFNGWNTKADGTGTSYQDGASVTLTENTTLYAQWRPIQYTISYALNGGTLSTSNPVNYDIESADIKLNNPSKTGYTFTGWTGTGLSGNTQTVTISKGTTGNRSYTANFSPIVYTISYELDDGTNNADNPNSYTIETETITLKAPTKAGYEFLGWTYEGEMITEIANGSTGDKTITATWEKVTQTQSPDTSTIPGAYERISISAEEISQMKEEELQKTFENKTDIVLTGKVENLLLILEKIEKVTTVKNLDLSLAKELTEVKLDDSHSIETLTIAGNKSIKTIEVNGCKTLKELNIEGCESLEYLDVSETSITYLNAQDCENLGTVYCASCDIEELNLEGCENLKTLDCRNNRLLMLNASVFENLSSLECSHQRAVKPLAKLINFVDLLFGRGKFATSATNEDSTYLKNVKNLKAYDEAGHALLKVKDSENGEVEFSGEPAKITYDYDTGFEDTMMDVEISVFESENELVGSSNGGCTFGFGTWALAVLMLLLIPILKMKTAKY